jgi:hypothetical protein
MVPDAAAAWTLVESFALSHKDEDPFRKHPLKTNAPVNEKSANFNRYRMSQPQMTSLKSVSTHWRATCSFPVDGIDGRDQARANFQDFDIMTFIGNGVCKPMEYVNIRGKCNIYIITSKNNGNDLFLGSWLFVSKLFNSSMLYLFMLARKFLIKRFSLS